MGAGRVFEFLLSPEGNGGVFYRVEERGLWVQETGQRKLEARLLSDHQLHLQELNAILSLTRESQG